MTTSNTDGHELSDEQIALLRQLPGFKLDSGTPCTCGIESISTSKRRGYSDFVSFTHRCRECGNRFKTWIEG